MPDAKDEDSKKKEEKKVEINKTKDDKKEETNKRTNSKGGVFIPSHLVKSKTFASPRYQQSKAANKAMKDLTNKLDDIKATKAKASPRNYKGVQQKFSFNNKDINTIYKNLQEVPNGAKTDRTGMETA